MILTGFAIIILLQIYIILQLRAIPRLKSLSNKVKSNLPAGIKPINPNTTERACQFCDSLNNVQRSPDGYYACNVCRATKLGLITSQHVQ